MKKTADRLETELRCNGWRRVWGAIRFKGSVGTLGDSSVRSNSVPVPPGQAGEFSRGSFRGGFLCAQE